MAGSICIDARGVLRHGAILQLPELGRLAQLVEHLVYTERVSGSSPLAPTSSEWFSFTAAGLTGPRHLPTPDIR